jgi:hypothetical protein
MTKWLLLAAAFLVAVLVVMKTTERFQPEFLDRTQIARTIAVQDSSYDQRTNHLNPIPVQRESLHGIETPFRVNQYTSYVV